MINIKMNFKVKKQKYKPIFLKIMINAPHIIPKTIYMCHKELNYIETYSQNWKILNPEYELKLYDNNMCEQFLLNEYGQLFKDVFNFIPDGPIKADFWRVCIIYRCGGIYVDADIEPLISLKHFLEDNITFATCIIGVRNYNPHIIISHIGNIYLKLCIDTYINYYLSKKIYSYDEWSIVCIVNNIFRYPFSDEGLYIQPNERIQLFKNKYQNGLINEHSVYKNIRVFNNRYPTYNNHNFIK